MFILNCYTSTTLSSELELYTAKLTDFILSFKSERPELQPSYLCSTELRKSILFNGKLIKLDINDETLITSTNNKSQYSSKSIHILAFQDMKELENIAIFCQTLLNQTGNVQNCMLLHIKPDTVNEKRSNLSTFDHEKIRIFCKTWNFPYLNDILNIKYNQKASEKVLRFCVKYYWFLALCSF